MLLSEAYALASMSIIPLLLSMAPGVQGLADSKKSPEVISPNMTGGATGLAKARPP